MGDTKLAEDRGTDTSAASDTAALIAAAVAKETEGLKANTARLLEENTKYKATLKNFEGIDPEKTKAMLSHFENNEEQKLIAEGRIDDVIQRRVAKREESVAQQIAEAQAEVEKAKAFATRFNAKYLQGELRTAFPTDVHQSMSVPLLRELEQLFTLDEEGNVVPKDGAMGKSGKALYAPKEAIEDLRGQYPGFFVNGNSGSSSFQGAGKGGAKTISREKYMTLTPAEQHDAYKNGITVVDR